MMAPDYTHWHGMYEVADRFYMHFLPEAHEITEKAVAAGKKEQADRVELVIADILARPEHQWILPAPPGGLDRSPDRGALRRADARTHRAEEVNPVSKWK